MVNGLDRDLWLANVGMSPLAVVPSGVSSVPEPGTLWLLSVVLLALSAYGLEETERWLLFAS